jgi:hypothetical protein
MARQAHSEHGFFLVGTHVDLTTMCPGDFAYNIQVRALRPRRYVTLPLVGASSKRIKDLVQSRSLNDWPAVHHLQANLFLLAG